MLGVHAGAEHAAAVRQGAQHHLQSVHQAQSIESQPEACAVAVDVHANHFQPAGSEIELRALRVDAESTELKLVVQPEHDSSTC